VEASWVRWKESVVAIFKDIKRVYLCIGAIFILIVKEKQEQEREGLESVKSIKGQD
jgi:hypothetical protein